MAKEEQQRPDGDSIAERRDGIALTSALALDRRALLESLQLIVNRATAQPRAVVDIASALLGEFVKITIGDKVAATPTDTRFKDAAWRDNPLFRRMGQAYLAWSKSLDDWLARSNFDALDHARARFMLDIVKDVTAPMNTLAGNPEALRKLWQTRGDSVMKGLRNYINDVRHNHGYPTVADRDAFKVGIDVAASPGAVVFRNELLEVIQYWPNKPSVHAIPLVYVFSQVNRFYLGDLTPERSLFQKLLDVGIQVFAVSWRNPTEKQRDWGLDTYAEGVIHALAVARQISAQPQRTFRCGAKVAGTLRRCIRRKERLRNVRVAASGGERDDVLAQQLSARRRPDRTSAIVLVDGLHPFARGSIRGFPRSVVCQQTREGEAIALGKRIDLKDVKCDVFVMAGSTDHITPWMGCYRSTQLLGGRTQFVLTNQNHTQTISARGDNRHLKYWIADELPPSAADWMKLARETPGDWREHWLIWLAQRSGSRIPARSSLGSSAHPSLDAAPGRYVVET